MMKNPRLRSDLQGDASVLLENDTFSERMGLLREEFARGGDRFPPLGGSYDEDP